MILLRLRDIFLYIADLVNFGIYSSLVAVGLSSSPQFVRRSILPAHGSRRRKSCALEDYEEVMTEAGETSARADAAPEGNSQPAGREPDWTPFYTR